jgi:hypothetical protein|tara:strand:+ start:852 stop:1379 length:528 start_codon:yes stop_codon:yes gene_type:complete
MKTDNIERYLNSFGKYVVKQSRTNLTKGKKNVSKELYNSISFKVVTDANGFSVQFYMADYGTFIDKGVSGNKQQRSYKDYTGKTVKSPYKYTTKQPPSKLLDKWIVKKGIAPRDKQGKFMSRKSISFLIARSIKIKGIKSTSFFQRPMELALKDFSKDLLGSIKEDIIEGLTTVN